MTFAARVAEGATGGITVEFVDEIGDYKNLLKDLFLEVIDGYGISIPAIEQWEPKFTDKTMTLSGSDPSSCGSLRRGVLCSRSRRPSCRAGREHAGRPERGRDQAVPERP